MSNGDQEIEINMALGVPRLRMQDEAPVNRRRMRLTAQPMQRKTARLQAQAMHLAKNFVFQYKKIHLI